MPSIEIKLAGKVLEKVNVTKERTRIGRSPDNDIVLKNPAVSKSHAVIENTAELNKAFFAGRCDVITSDASQLAGHRAVAPNPDDYVILPEIISKEPLAPAVRHGDNQWKDIVNYSVLAMINAEELGITSENVDEMKNSQDPIIQRFLGVTPGNGQALGLDEAWAYNIIKQVGNYGEVFERNVGASTPLKLERGLNALWVDGGLMYSAPFK